MIRRIGFVLFLMISISACSTREVEVTNDLHNGAPSASPTTRSAESETHTATLTMTKTPRPTWTPSSTVTPYPTFRAEEAVTHTQAPPAVCPGADPNYVFAPDISLDMISSGIEYLNLIDDELDSGASFKAISDAINQYIYRSVFLELRDITGDGVLELIVHNILSMQVYSCIDGEYRRFQLPDEPEYRAPHILTVEDMNLDNTPEVVLYTYVSTGNTVAVRIYEWNGEAFVPLIRSAHSDTVLNSSRIARAFLWYDELLLDDLAYTYGGEGISIVDLDGNGTKELMLSDEGPGHPDIVRNNGPWRGKRLVYTWNGIHFLLSYIEMDPPEYRFQAVQDADQAALVGDYDRALALYQEAIFNDELAYWTADHRQYLAEMFDAEGEGKPTPTPPTADPDEYDILSAYARFRIMLLYLMQGWDDEAQVVYETLQDLYPEDSAGYFFVELAQKFWGSFEFTSSIGYGCERAIDYVQDEEDILEVLGDYEHGSQSHKYSAEDVCPFIAREGEGQGHTAEDVVEMYLDALLIVSSVVDRETGEELDERMLYTMYLDGTVGNKVSDSGASYSDPVWSPDCQQIAVSRSIKHDDDTYSHDIVIMDVEGKILKEISVPNLRLDTPNWSPDGERIVYESWNGENTYLFVYDFASDSTEPILQEGSYAWPDWSPTGNQILYGTYLSDGYKSFDSTIRIMNLDDSGQREIVPSAWDTGAWDFENPKMYQPIEPTWSPDGKRIAFLVTEDILEMKATKIYLVNADGSDLHCLIDGNPRQQVPEYPGFYYGWKSVPVWSPDGKYILFTRSYFTNGDEIVKLCYANANTGEWSCLGEKSGIGIWGMDWCHASQ